MSKEKNQDRVQEELRIKNAKLKKLDAERSRQETKIKHLMTLSTKRLSELQQQLVEKDDQLRFQQSLPSSDQSAEHYERQVDTTTSTKKEAAPLQEEALKEDKGAQLHEQITQLLNDLKTKNGKLTLKVSQEHKENERLAREKSILAKEVRRLRNNPATLDIIKDQVNEVETQSDAAQDRFEKLIKEKDTLIETYESLLKESVEGKEETDFPSDVVKQLRDELETIRDEKSQLEKDLVLERKKFQAQLSHEIKRVEETLGKKKKQVQQGRRKLTTFAGEVMDEDTAPGWMVTYADMTTLLLTFFILYYSLASINMKKFKEAILGEEQASIGLLELLDAVEQKESIEVLTGLKSNDILSDIKHVADNETMNSVMDVSTDSNKIIIRVPGQTLFESGKANLDINESRPVLDELIRIIGKYPNYKISIQGHTDDSPIFSKQFPSNWELSAARATAVLRYFIDKNIDPKRLTATGYADIFPIVSNKSELGQSTNRRVEFVLEKEN